MILTAAVFAVLLTLDPPKKAPDPVKPPAGAPSFVDEEDAANLPQHFKTYGKEKTQDIFNLCLLAGTRRGFEPKSVEDYCTCHLYIMEDVITFPELEKLSDQDKAVLFIEISNACRELGVVPKVADPKRKPDPDRKIKIYRDPGAIDI